MKDPAQSLLSRLVARMFFRSTASLAWGAGFLPTDAPDAHEDPHARGEDDEPVEFPYRPEFRDIRADAATARYRSSDRVKLTRYARRKPGVSRCITWHQMGVERAIDSPRYHLVSAHYVILRDGTILWLFDHDVRLASSNSLDRAPWHAINVEIAGNFEGEDGSGRWWSPERMGKGRATKKQLQSIEWLASKICDDVQRDGGRIEMFAPHRVSGRNLKGIPNRQICPGSRVWAAAEEAAISLGVSVPESGEAFGGLPIPPEWRSETYRICEGLAA